MVHLGHQSWGHCVGVNMVGDTEVIGVAGVIRLGLESLVSGSLGWGLLGSLAWGQWVSGLGLLVLSHWGGISGVGVIRLGSLGSLGMGLLGLGSLGRCCWSHQGWEYLELGSS